MSYTIHEYHGEYNTRPRSASDVRYIVVHYTGSGTSAAGAARANCIYFSGGDRQASAHYFIDDENIYEYAYPSTKLCWHVGDGHGAYGITNTNSIGIEVCMDGDNPFTSAEVDRLHWLVRKLMADFDVDADHVVRHYDASRKACPFYYTPSGSGGNAAWNDLHDRITAEQYQAGWVKSGSKWWWRNADGSYPASCWQKIAGSWYLFDAKGWMLTGWQKWRGKWYYLRENGAMVAGSPYEVDGKWYAFDKSGAMLEGSVPLRKGGSMVL